MTPSLYEQLRTKIVAACPDILELKFGCEINYGIFPLRELRRGVVSYSHDSSMCVLHEGRIPDFITPERDINEILGRPVLLSDVLRAMEENRLQSSSSPFSIYFIDEDGFFHVDFKDEPMRMIDSDKWDTAKPHLSDQSDELGEWLNGIL